MLRAKHLSLASSLRMLVGQLHHHECSQKDPGKIKDPKNGKMGCRILLRFSKNDFRYTKGLCTNLYYSPCEMKNKKRVIIQSSQCKLAICLALGGPSQKHGKRRYYWCKLAIYQNHFWSKKSNPFACSHVWVTWESSAADVWLRVTKAWECSNTPDCNGEYTVSLAQR